LDPHSRAIERNRSYAKDSPMKTSFAAGRVWNDLDGVPIQAHGGCVLYDRGTYYWFGENKNAITHRRGVVGFNVDAVGVSCYASTDLYNWENRGLVLPAVKEPVEDELHTSKIIERPRVIYNALTRKYVMFLHVDKSDYQYARVGIAVGDTPAGAYEYLGSFAPHGSDSRDMTVFRDDDGRAYLIHSSEWNATLYVGELTSYYGHTIGRFTKNFPQGYREAPAVFKRNGKYYLLTSGCTGWEPNPAEYAVAENILGPWEARGNPCIGPQAETTFNAQSTFVFPVAGQAEAYIAMFDIWTPEDLGASRYLWLPVQFKGDELVIEWADEWDLTYFR
jgi:beta-galactosidase